MIDSTTAALTEALRAICGEESVSEDRDALARYETGWRYGSGRGRLLVRPSTPEQVAKLLAHCNKVGARVQPIGANTGLVGASNPDGSGDMVLLSLERLSKVIEIDAIDGVAVVEAGVTLSQLNEALEREGMVFPIDLGADPQVGGMIATNTGGTRLVRYGDVRQNLLGLEVVFADGTVLSRMRRLYKDNTGLDVKQLFVGTSGTFGVITRAVLKVTPKPTQRVAILACLDDGASALALLETLERDLGEFLSAYEVISRDALDVTLRQGSIERNPFRGKLPRYVALIELSSRMPTVVLDLETLLHSTLERHMESATGSGLCDVLLGHAEDFWAIRHQVSECLRSEGMVLGLDLSVPRSKLAALTDAIAARLSISDPDVRICDFGHWADGGTHLNLVWPSVGSAAIDDSRKRILQQLVYTVCVDEFGGSYSAEHGVGPHNAESYALYTETETRRLCAAIGEVCNADARLGTVRL